jgi:hypothetical protein
MRGLDEPKRRRIVDTILVQVLQQVNEEQNRHDASIDFAQRLLHLCRIGFHAAIRLVRRVRVVELGRRWRGRDVLVHCGRSHYVRDKTYWGFNVFLTMCSYQAIAYASTEARHAIPMCSPRSATKVLEFIPEEANEA